MFVWVGLWVGDFSGFSSNPLNDMVGPCGLEPQTSTVSKVWCFRSYKIDYNPPGQSIPQPSRISENQRAL